MNLVSFALIVGLGATALMYMLLKNYYVNILTKNMKSAQYDRVIEDAQHGLCRKLLGTYNCDLFIARALYLKGDMIHLKNKALDMLTENYREDQYKTFIQLYYHIFLNSGEIETAEKFLDKIVKIQDNAFVKFNQYAYNVLVEKQSDLIDTMEAEIAAKIYEGFSLGTVVYLIAMQYLYKEDYANAELYFKECLTCFHPNAFYVEPAKKHIEELEKIAI